jgi:hypothetical protein
MIQLGRKQLRYSCLADCNKPAYPPILQYWPNVRAAASTCHGTTRAQNMKDNICISSVQLNSSKNTENLDTNQQQNIHLYVTVLQFKIKWNSTVLQIYTNIIKL